jgi:hypothetical protein
VVKAVGVLPRLVKRGEARRIMQRQWVRSVESRLTRGLLAAMLWLAADRGVVALAEEDCITLQIRFGMKDQQPTDWSGKLVVEAGRVESIRGWRWMQNDSAEDNGWTVRTRRKSPQSSADRKRVASGLPLPMTDNGILVTLRGCGESDPLRLETTQARLTFRLAQLPFGASLSAAEGNVVIQRVPTVEPLTTSQADEDYPAATTSSDGTVYAVYLAFTRGRDFQGEREQVATAQSPLKNPAALARVIEQPGDLAYLAQPAGGEQLFLRILRDGVWSEPVAVTDGEHELYRPAIAVAGDGRVWVIYSAHLDCDKNLDHGNWELLARSFAADGGDPSPVVNISRAAGTDFMPAAASDSQGRVWATWVGARGNRFHVYTAHGEGDGFSPPQRISEFTGNEWEPAIAADKRGHVAVAWDTFEKGDYDVYVATRGSDGSWSRPQAVAASLAFEVRPSIAFDPQSRLWIAYETSGDQWGKDFGALKKKGIPLYQTGRSLVVKVRDAEGGWHAPADVMHAMPGALRAGPAAGRAVRRPQGAQPQREPITAIAPTYPRLGCDAAGQVWLAFRGKLGGNWRVRVGSVWCEYFTRLGADGWSEATVIPHSNNILDNRPSLTAVGAADMLAVFSGDGRGEVNRAEIEDAHLPGSPPAADEGANRAPPRRQRGGDADQSDPNNQILVSRIAASDFAGVAGAPQLTELAAEIPAAPADDVTAERADIQRIRDYRVELGEETLQIWRGEFHRHTELSPDGGGDGGLLDMWRYAIDAAGMDWIGDGDHDYGNGREYSWWTTQKAVTLFTLPEHFVPVYSYERSVSYPEGHRNCMFAYRGVRSLPRLPISSPDQFAPAPDTNLLYMYLHYFDGICASHTSATDMGTDWRNHDPQVEPFVEIYQGDRNNYERPDSPRSAVTEAKLKQSTPEQESIGGWRPKGFVNLALLKGYRLAFQASSDHISTHLSYCNVFVTEPTRQGIVDAIRRRRVYGATDNIVADVRCKVGEQEHFMGEEFTTSTAPTLDVRLIGARPIAKVTIIKDDVEVLVREPNEQEVHFQWTDPDPTIGKTSYYYVRGEQQADLDGASAGELVWASPMWILVRPD